MHPFEPLRAYRRFLRLPKNVLVLISQGTQNHGFGPSKNQAVQKLHHTSGPMMGERSCCHQKCAESSAPFLPRALSSNKFFKCVLGKANVGPKIIQPDTTP